jgi:hypothetical protein
MVVRALAVRPPSPLQGQVTSTGGGGDGLGHDLCAAVVRQHQSRRWGSGLTGGPAPVAVAGAVTVPLSIGAAGGGGVTRARCGSPLTFRLPAGYCEGRSPVSAWRRRTPTRRLVSFADAQGGSIPGLGAWWDNPAVPDRPVRAVGRRARTWASLVVLHNAG